MKENTYKKSILLITYAMLLAFLIWHIKDVFAVIGKAATILSPLWIGIACALVLNVPTSIIEKKVFGHTNKKIRIVSLLLSIMLILFLVVVLFAWVIPDFIASATYLLSKIPVMLEDLNDFLIETFKNTDLSEYMRNFSASNEVTNIASGIFKTVINNFTGILSNFAATVVNLITGIIIAVYFLLEKENILGVFKSTIDKIFKKNTKDKIYEVAKLSNKSFHDFVTYQCLECLILGFMMFIALTIFRLPYALSIAFLTTITAIVPIFGATVACVVGTILVGMTSIKESIIFIIVFQVVQQIENNIIYPRVVGKHVGLPPVITILAIIVGGNLGGFMGMILAIPITSVVLSLFVTKFMNNLEPSEEEKSKGKRKKKVIENGV